MREFMKIVNKLTEDVWHGSPNVFSKFSSDFIGDGEGFQSFGWGLYFTETHSLAVFYHRKLTKVDNIRPDQKAIADYKDKWEELTKRLRIMRDFFDHNKWSDDPEKRRKTISYIPRIKKLEAQLEAYSAQMLKDTYDRFEGGAIYEVTIPDGPYLLWDVTLDDPGQPTAQIMPLIKKTHREPSEITGEDLYRALADMTDWHSASMLLLQHGVVGNKYLDARTRSDPDDNSFNYVVFDDKSITVKRVMKQPKKVDPDFTT